MGALHELKSPALYEGNIMAGQLDFQVEGVEAGTKQHGNIPQGYSFFSKFQYLLANEAGLHLLIFGSDQQWDFSMFLAGKQIFVVSLLRPAYDFVGKGQDGQRAAVVLLQVDEFGPRKISWEIHDVAKIGSPERVDALGVVSHHHDIIVRGSQKADDLGLKAIGVLVFVHQDITVAVGQMAADRGATRAMGAAAKARADASFATPVVAEVLTDLLAASGAARA